MMRDMKTKRTSETLQTKIDFIIHMILKMIPES